MRFFTNRVKQKLISNELVLGSWISLSSLETTEIMSNSYLDFLVIDAEHSVIDLNMIQKMNMIIEKYGVYPFVRVSQNDPNIIKRALDTGCYGIVIPNVETKEEAQIAVSSCFYKPKGIRGIGMSRAQGYGISLDAYLSWYEANLSIVIQIESEKAVSNLREILSVAGINTTMVGPYDLSASLGKPGKLFDNQVKDLLGNYEKISRDMNMPYGCHIVIPNEEELRNKINQGYSFVAYGVDQVFLSQSVEKTIGMMRNMKRNCSYG